MSAAPVPHRRLLSHRLGITLLDLLVVLAGAAVILALGSPVVRTTLSEQRLGTGAQELSHALAEARREAFRSAVPTRVEVDPRTGRFSVLAFSPDSNREVEQRRGYLPESVVFDGIASVTSYAFDDRGRPAGLPMVLHVRSAHTGAVRVVSVLGSGRVTVT